MTVDLTFISKQLERLQATAGETNARLAVVEDHLTKLGTKSDKMAVQMSGIKGGVNDIEESMKSIAKRPDRNR